MVVVSLHTTANDVVSHLMFKTGGGIQDNLQDNEQRISTKNSVMTSQHAILRKGYQNA